MNWIHDHEMRRELLLFGAATVGLPLLGLLFSPAAALGLFLGLAAADFLHFHTMLRRRRQMQQLSSELSRLLSGAQSLSLEEYREGELAVLRSELQKLLTKLRASNQALLEERSMLEDSLADISHQLRTPMTSMELILTLLRSPSTTEEKRRRLLRDLEKLLQRTEWLIEALLKLSRLDAGTVHLQPQACSLPALVRRASEPLLAAIELREQELITEVPDITLTCDPLWTAEALTNLLKNAMEHTPAGGTIQILAQATPVYTQIILQDSGTGFDPEDLPHVFERFYRGKNADPGSFGIGLALTRRILSEQDCTIQASNHFNGGAVFTLRFYHTTV